MKCCVCGSEKGVEFCSICKHNFCEDHRAEDGWWLGQTGGVWKTVVGLWQRGAAAVSQWLLDNPPQFCEGHGEEEGAGDAEGLRSDA